jgi:hypothetical protein
LLDEVARGEIVEKELDAFIERRSLRMNPEQGRIEELFAESTRIHQEQARRANRARWYAFHLGQAERIRRTMTALAEAHEAKAAALLDEGRG